MIAPAKQMSAYYDDHDCRVLLVIKRCCDDQTSINFPGMPAVPLWARTANARTARQIMWPYKVATRDWFRDGCEHHNSTHGAKNWKT